MIINHFNRFDQAYMVKTDIVEVEWHELMEVLVQHNKEPLKEKVPLFNLWEFNKDGEKGRKYRHENGKRTSEFHYRFGTVRRCGDNALALTGLVLDIDDNMSIKEALAKFSKYELLIYTTHSHSASKDKFRVVLPFKSKMPKDVFQRKLKSMVEYFGVARESFSISQCWHYHSGPTPKLFYNEGAWLDWEQFDDEVVPEPKDRKYDGDYEIDDAYKMAMFAGLMGCKNIRYASGLPLATLLKSIGAGIEEFRTVIYNTAGQDSSIRDSAVIEMLWNDATGDRMFGHNRDAFLAQHGSSFKIIRSEEDMLKYRLAQKKKRLDL